MRAFNQLLGPLPNAVCLEQLNLAHIYMFFRFKKKKEYERMTTEEKKLYKLLKVSCIF